MCSSSLKQQMALRLKMPLQAAALWRTRVDKQRWAGLQGSLSAGCSRGAALARAQLRGSAARAGMQVSKLAKHSLVGRRPSISCLLMLAAHHILWGPNSSSSTRGWWPQVASCSQPHLRGRHPGAQNETSKPHRSPMPIQMEPAAAAMVACIRCRFPGPRLGLELQQQMQLW